MTKCWSHLFLKTGYKCLTWYFKYTRVQNGIDVYFHEILTTFEFQGKYRELYLLLYIYVLLPLKCIIQVKKQNRLCSLQKVKRDWLWTYDARCRTTDGNQLQKSLSDSLDLKKILFKGCIVRCINKKMRSIDID